MEPLLICFDFDGTIANTMPFLEQNAIKLIAENYDNLTELDARQKYRLTSGLPFEQQINLIFPNQQQNDTVIKEFEQLKISNIHDQELFPETKRVFTHLRSLQHIIAISSSTTQEIINDYLSIKGLKQLVNEVLGYRPGFEKGKHHFDFLLKKYTSLKPANLVYIGDSLKDMERAFNSNIRFIGRLGPMFNKDDFKLKDSKGSWIIFPTINSLNQIIQMI